MKNTPENIFPVFSQLLKREDKEQLLQQHAKTIWFTGLSGSGKSTVAVQLERRLHEAGYLTAVLDGDNVRSGINNNLGFSEEDRIENVRRIAEVNNLLLDTGVIVINCFVSPTEEIRNIARKIIGKDNFIEIFVNCSLEVCEERDVKGLYKKARRGEIKDFTGINAPFEVPLHADVEIRTDLQAIEESVGQVFNFIEPKIKSNKI